MSDDTYQGWTNWDTWNANLWLTNEPAIYNAAMDCRNVFELRSIFEAAFSTSRAAFVDGIDPLKVNWQEIYNALHEGEGLEDDEDSSDDSLHEGEQR